MSNSKNTGHQFRLSIPPPPLIQPSTSSSTLLKNGPTTTTKCEQIEESKDEPEPPPLIYLNEKFPETLEELLFHQWTLGAEFIGEQQMKHFDG